MGKYGNSKNCENRKLITSYDNNKKSKNPENITKNSDKLENEKIKIGLTEDKKYEKAEMNSMIKIKRKNENVKDEVETINKNMIDPNVNKTEKDSGNMDVQVKSSEDEKNH